MLNIYRLFMIFPGLMLGFRIAAQPGCTDPQALNLNAGATENDGSCQYAVTNYTPVFKTNLDNTLKEISGLALAGNQWWSHNDSGNDNTFYSFSVSNGAILKSIEIKNGTNNDWEDIATDGSYLYIGDFGNNENNRTDLGIYRVPLSAIGNGSNQSVNQSEYSFIPFAYPDQTDFSTTAEDSASYDCEAMLFAGGKMHLFTKNHRNYTTSHYTVDPTTGEAEYLESFDIQGLITGAAISPDGEVIALVGYNLIGLPTVFCWFLWDWDNGTDLYFSGNKRRIEFGSALLVGQVESIAFETNRSGYIGNERTEYNNILLVNESVRAFDCSAWIPDAVPVVEVPISGLKIFPNPAGAELQLSDASGAAKPVRIQILNMSGILVYDRAYRNGPIPVSHLASGVYMLLLMREDGSIERSRFAIR